MQGAQLVHLETLRVPFLQPPEQRFGRALRFTLESKQHFSPRVQTEVADFHPHRDHLHGQRIRRHGGPNGRGAMETPCGAFQDRLQRTRQFWSQAGLRHLPVGDVAVRDQDFETLWN
jgi:hypothetical protein